MKAIVQTAYGAPEVLVLRELAKPVPKDDQILVKIHAANVNSSDTQLRSGDFPALFWLPARLLYGVRKPRKLIPGYEFSGVVEAVGSAVTKFKPGDAVLGAASWTMGCSAEYLCIKQDAAIAVKPETMSFAEAAAFCDALCTALYYLKQGKIEKGKKILIYGASGSVGTAAVQLARYFNAEVTAVCSSRNNALALSLGADRVVNYTSENFADAGPIYDIVFDTLGKADFIQCLHALKIGGYFLSTRMTLLNRTKAWWLPIAQRKHMVGGMTLSNADNIKYLLKLYQQKDLRVVIDRCYPLAEIVEAHRYVDSGRKRGNVVLTIVNEQKDVNEVSGKNLSDSAAYDNYSSSQAVELT